MHDAGEIGGERCRGLVAALFGERRVAREVEEGDRGRLLGLLRGDPPLLHELLGDPDEVLEHGALSVPPLEPRDEALDELGVRARALVDERVLLLVGEVEVRHLLPHEKVEELEPGADEPLDRPAVEPREARELVVLGQVEGRDDELQHLSVLVAEPIVLGRREAEFPAEPSQEVGIAAEVLGKPCVGRGRLDRLGQEEP